MVKNILLTGEKQVGKTTIIEKLIQKSPYNFMGFRTYRRKREDDRYCFEMEAINSYILGKNKTTIGYCDAEKVNIIPEAFDGYGAILLEECLDCRPDFIIMDELGFFENDAYVFRNAVLGCFRSSIPILGVIKKKHTEFLDEIKKRDDTTVLSVTAENREVQYTETFKLLNELLQVR